MIRSQRAATKKIVAIPLSIFSTFFEIPVVFAEEIASEADQIIIVTARRSPVIEDSQTETPNTESDRIRDGFALIRDMEPSAGLFEVNASQSFVALRGAVSLDESASADPSIALLVDDFYVGRGAASRVRIPDLDSVAIFRGPQGVRFGKNALGGAINFVTSSVGGENGRLRLIANDAPGVSGEASEQLSISKATDLRFGIFGSKGAGDVPNRLTGSKLGKREEAGAYAKLQTELPGSTYLWLSGSVQREWNGKEPRFIWFNTAPALPNVVTLTDQAVFQSQDVSSNLRVERFIGKLGRDATDTSGWLLIAGHQFAAASVSNNDFAPGGGLAQILATDTKDRERATSIELRGWADIGPLSALGGLYYRRSDAFRSEDFILDPAPGSQAGIIFTDALKRNRVTQDVDIDEMSGFGTISLEFGANFRAELGGRYAFERKKGSTAISGDSRTFLLRSQPFHVVWAKSWESFAPNAMLEWKNNAMQVQLLWSRGFKSGGFTNSVNNPVSAATPFNPEKAEAFELKLQTGRDDNYGQIRLAAYTNKYRDLQTLLVRSDPQQGIIQEVVNAGEARARGIDADYRISRGPSFFQATVRYLNAKYTDFVNIDPTRGPLIFTGNPIPLSPKWSMKIGAGTGVQTSFGELLLAAQLLYRSKVSFFPDPSQSALVRNQTDSFELNSTIGTRFEWGSLKLIGSNLLDSRPFTFANSASSSFYFSGASIAAGSRLVYGSRAPGRKIAIEFTTEF